jgi:gamma-glutamyltranspeptidase/glutathione hydrolase
MIEGREVVSELGAVAAPAEAARIGARVLASGGNAMDAIAATAMACCMIRPDMTGVGGYGFCAVVLEGGTGRVSCIDANSRAPAAAHAEMFDLLPVSSEPQTGHSINRDEYNCRVTDDANIYGPLAVGVPGMVAGMGILWERWGRLKWPDIIEPSLALLEAGLPYGPVVGSIRHLETVIRRFPATAEHLMPGGRVPAEDDTWQRPDMDKTLARLAQQGWRDFYQGELGRVVADYLQSAGGVLTRDDMARYEPQVTQPLTTTYRGATVHGVVLANGGLTSLQALNMLECFAPAKADSVEYWHVLAEVLKQAWRDRLTYLGDPDFAPVPVERLLSKDYAAGRVEAIKQHPSHVDQCAPDLLADGPGGTVHVSGADAEGNLVAATITQGGAFGSCVTVPGTGIILGHGMCRLDPRPGRANSIAPRKRPLNNMAPMVVRLPDRDIAVGMPGGRRIISVAAQLVQRIVDRGATGNEAATAPRMHVEFREPLQVTKSIGEEVVEGLRRMGHEVEAVRAVGGAAHCAEWLKEEKAARAGGNEWAAGV